MVVPVVLLVAEALGEGDGGKMALFAGGRGLTSTGPRAVWFGGAVIWGSGSWVAVNTSGLLESLSPATAVVLVVGVFQRVGKAMLAGGVAGGEREGGVRRWTAGVGATETPRPSFVTKMRPAAAAAATEEEIGGREGGGG